MFGSYNEVTNRTFLVLRGPKDTAYDAAGLRQVQGESGPLDLVEVFS